MWTEFCQECEDREILLYFATNNFVCYRFVGCMRRSRTPGSGTRYQYSWHSETHGQQQRDYVSSGPRILQRCDKALQEGAFALQRAAFQEKKLELGEPDSFYNGYEV